MPHRDYTTLQRTFATIAGGTREERMTAAVDALWDAFHNRGVSWVGFYVPDADGESMILGPRRDKPACSPLGMHGACGQCFRSRATLVVHDVAELGESYIACDPRDRSEVVIPLFDDRGECWGVLDVDSFDVGAFSEHDARELAALMRVAGLSTK